MAPIMRLATFVLALAACALLNLASAASSSTAVERAAITLTHVAAAAQDLDAATGTSPAAIALVPVALARAAEDLDVSTGTSPATAVAFVQDPDVSTGTSPATAVAHVPASLARDDAATEDLDDSTETSTAITSGYDALIKPTSASTSNHPVPRTSAPSLPPLAARDNSAASDNNGDGNGGIFNNPAPTIPPAHDDGVPGPDCTVVSMFDACWMEQNAGWIQPATTALIIFDIASFVAFVIMFRGWRRQHAPQAADRPNHAPATPQQNRSGRAPLPAAYQNQAGPSTRQRPNYLSDSEEDVGAEERQREFVAFVERQDRVVGELRRAGMM